MPSQEDYLDKLLRNLGAEVLKDDEQTEESVVDTEEAALESALSENTEGSETDVNNDAILSEVEESAIDLDVLLPETEESAIDLDALLPETEESAVDLDALLPEAEESAIDLDALLPETEESAVDLDALLPEAEESAIDLDALFPEAEESAVDLDVLLPEAEESAIDLDALLPETEESAVDLDALLPETESEVVEPEPLYGSSTEASEEPLHLDDGSVEWMAVDEDEDGISDIENLLSDETAGMEDLPEDILSDIRLSEESTVTEDLSASASEADHSHDLEDFLDSDDGQISDEDDVLDEDDYQASSDLDALNSMSEDDIERILSAGAGDLEDAADGTELAEDGIEDDVLGMLEDSDDGDLQEIHQLLDRADNNEAVDDEITALLQEAPPEEDLEKKILGEDTESESSNPKAEKAKEKERLRREKAEAKKAAKEAKEAAKAAAKEAKAAAKAARSNTTAHEQTASVLPTASNEDDHFDTSILDSIVSEAEAAGSKESTDIISQAIGEGMGEDDIFNASDLFGGDIGADNIDSGNDNLTGEAESDDGFGFDMGSLFGDSEDSNLRIEAAEPGDLVDFPDFVDMDSDNVDKLVSGIDEGGKKKKGLLARIFDFLTEEDEEEENEALQLSDENREILNDLDKEKTKGKKKKKGKKASAKGEEEKGKGKPKKAKKPKPEKPKKEKVPDPEPLIPERRLTLKRVLPVLLVCASLAVLIIVFINASVDFTSKKTAQEAYYNGDYQACYQNLYGRDLNEAEQIMFGTSESILRIRLWLAEYELFVNSGDDLRALDSLITAVKEYPKLYAYAVQWNAGDEVDAGYQHLLTILSQNYGLTQEQALEIANARSDIEYTRMVLFIVQGRGFGSWDVSNTVTKPSSESTEGQLPDALPEESEMDESTFINN